MRIWVLKNSFLYHVRIFQPGFGRTQGLQGSTTSDGTAGKGKSEMCLRGRICLGWWRQRVPFTGRVNVLQGADCPGTHDSGDSYLPGGFMCQRRAARMQVNQCGMHSQDMATRNTSCDD